MKNKFTSFDELPITISADEVAMVLGISQPRDTLPCRYE